MLRKNYQWVKIAKNTIYVHFSRCIVNTILTSCPSWIQVAEVADILALHQGCLSAHLSAVRLDNRFFSAKKKPGRCNDFVFTRNVHQNMFKLNLKNNFLGTLGAFSRWCSFSQVGPMALREPWRVIHPTWSNPTAMRPYHLCSNLVVGKTSCLGGKTPKRWSQESYPRCQIP